MPCPSSSITLGPIDPDRSEGVLLTGGGHLPGIDNPPRGELSDEVPASRASGQMKSSRPTTSQSTMGKTTRTSEAMQAIHTRGL